VAGSRVRRGTLVFPTHGSANRRRSLRPVVRVHRRTMHFARLADHSGHAHVGKDDQRAYLDARRGRRQERTSSAPELFGLRHQLPHEPRIALDARPDARCLWVSCAPLRT